MGVSLISNPPYNLKLKHPQLAGFMPQYMGWEMPPEANANYAFVLSALNWADDKVVILLPNGVLTARTKSEIMIKKQLIKENLLLAVITLPGNMFESTNIPTCLLLFDKHKETKQIAMIDLTDQCEEEVRHQRGQFGGSSHMERVYHKTVAVIPQAIMERCVDIINNHTDADFAVWVDSERIAENGYSLSPRQYMGIKSEIKHRPFEDIAEDYNRIIRTKNSIKIKMNKTAAKRLGFDCMDREEINLEKTFAVVNQKVEKGNYIRFSADDGIEIKCSTKDDIPQLIRLFLAHWKESIIYLNNEENRLLAEFRDALLPELMSGSIQIKEDSDGSERD